MTTAGGQVATVRVVECRAPQQNNWELASQWRPPSATTHVTYELPEALWESYVAARSALMEAESAIDIYVEMLHEENDEFSRLS